MRRRLFGMFTIFAALCLTLVGCGGAGGNAGGASASGANFVGHWSLESMVEDGEAVSSDDIALMRSYGLNVYLVINEDGTLTLNLYGEDLAGTWSATSDTNGTITLAADNNEAGLDPNAAMTYADGKLTISSTEGGDTSMTFEKSTQQEIDAAKADNQDDVDEEEDLSSDSTPLDVVVADDDKLTLKLTSMEDDSDGDPNINFIVTNKTDQSVYLTEVDDSWTVDGVVVDPVVSTDLDAGETLDDFLFFHRDELGGGIDKLTNVHGSFELQDAEDNVIATYEVSF